MRIALREMRRSKLRFALLGGAVGLLVLLLLFFQAVAGTLVTALTGAVDEARADVLVYDDRARGNPVTSVLPLDVVDAVAAVEGVEEAAGIALTVTPVTADGEERGAVLIGFDPGAPGTPATLEQGRLPEADDEALSSGSGFEPGFPLGAVVTVGDAEIEIVGTAVDAAYNATPTLYVTHDAFAAFVRDRTGGQAPVTLSAVAVEAAGGSDPTALAERISSEVDGVEALDKAAAVAALPGIDTIDRSFGILYVLLFLVVTIVTGVFFLILTVQKRQALVLLRAVGAERGDVVRLVLFQVVLVVGIGVLVGIGLAGGLLAASRDVFGSALDAGTTIRSAAAILALALLAALGAVRRVLAIDPVEATSPGGLS